MTVSKRCIPTRFFKDPDIINLSKDSQLILIGLALSGDDEGRGVADPKLLGREIDYPPEQVEVALKALAENGLITLYQVGRHRYYQIIEDWQKSMGARRTHSRLPAPPDLSAETPDLSAETPPQSNLIQSNLIEDEEKSETFPNVLAFPTPPDGDDVSQEVFSRTHEVARILKLSVTEALVRIVQEYLCDPTISLLGEADEAREWCDDPHRNKKKQPMTPAFFRRWLKREQASKARGTGTTGGPPAQPPHSVGAARGLSAQSLMGLTREHQFAPYSQVKGDASP